MAALPGRMAAIDLPQRLDMFKAHDVAPITWLQDGVGIYELSNGPSLSINDFSLQFLSQVHEKHWDKGPRSITLLGATTGDMGASAEAAFGGRSGVKVVMLRLRRMSKFQAAQALFQ